MKLLKRKFTQTLQWFYRLLVSCLPKRGYTGTCEIRYEKGKEKEAEDELAKQIAIEQAKLERLKQAQLEQERIQKEKQEQERL